ncbi:MAG: AraC family transcriptional regulator [Flavitalea sp.]
MVETTGLLERITHHEKVRIALNKDCSIALPDEVMEILTQPHKLSFYYFQYIDNGSATFKADLKEFTISDGQVGFGLPNQVFTKRPYDKTMLQYMLSFDESTLKLLPSTYPFLIDPLSINYISFEAMAQERIKFLFLSLFQLLHFSKKQRKVDLILSYMHALLTEFNTAYFEQHAGIGFIQGSRLSKFIDFKLTVESNLTEQHDVQGIADKLALTSGSLYGIVKEYAGISPKEWIISRLMLEAQKQLQYSSISVKELAYNLGFNDPGYFSRLFRKTTGKSVSKYLTELREISEN